ncbi:MAG: methyltransferase domain-containing protein [Acidobacteria bacterium]|nr:methyltransferase domain-containing protein [Acidobacteriota bacterium]NIQ30713.1 methyltransferase domain-containing protein [Acidobacteriota bacterium]NIQ85709.1 methyltransferase domain-containing protein [Acidobacteriota bacterium]
MNWGPEDWDRWLAERDRPGPTIPETVFAIERWLARLPSRRTKTVADLGCGLGTRLPLLASRFGEVIAVDYAPAGMARLRARYADLGIEFRRRDLRDLCPFYGRLDAAIAIDSIRGPRLSDFDRILQQIRRCLVEGGLLLATFPAAPKNTIARAMLLDDGEGTPAPGEFHEIELQYRLQRAGLRGAAIRRVPDHEGRESLVCRAVRRADN